MPSTQSPPGTEESFAEHLHLRTLHTLRVPLQERDRAREEHSFWEAEVAL